MVKLPSISSSVLWNVDAGKSCRRAEITSTGASFTNSGRSSKMSAQARKAINDLLSKTSTSGSASSATSTSGSDREGHRRPL